MEDGMWDVIAVGDELYRVARQLHNHTYDVNGSFSEINNSEVEKLFIALENYKKESGWTKLEQEHMDGLPRS